MCFEHCDSPLKSIISCVCLLYLVVLVAGCGQMPLIAEASLNSEVAANISVLGNNELSNERKASSERR